MNQDERVKLIISYSAEQEIQRVQHTIRDLPWYSEQGYPADFAKLPVGITKDSSDEEIKQAVNNEYSDVDYAESATKLKQEWAVVSQGFKKMLEEPSFHLGNEYEVVLTKYGSGGSYNANKNWVIVRAAAKSKGGTAGIVAHEIVHMTIQYLINQYHIQHWYKERLVDLLVEHYFPGLKMMQNIKEDVSIVDRAFEKSFPNMEAIAKTIGE